MVALSTDYVNNTEIMFLSRKFISSVSQFSIGLRNSQAAVLLPVLQKSNESCKKKFQNSAWRNKDKLPSSVSSKYEYFSEESSSVVLDVEEERKKIDQEGEIIDQFEGLNLQRGVSGVFDLEEIVQLLQREKAKNIFVAKIPSELNYADYMVVVTGRSKRHMLAVFEFIRKVFKRKMSSNDVIPVTEGLTSNDWMAIDLGNIVVHMFSKKARETYDLESLWSLGSEYDALSQGKLGSESQVLCNYKSLLAHLIPDKSK